MTVLDASVLIAHLDARDAHHGEARALLVGSPNEDLRASVVTIAEVLVGPARHGQLPRAQRALARLGVRPVLLEGDDASRLAVLRADTRLRLPDCYVLLAAEQTGHELATFDDGLRRAATGLGIPATPD